MSEESPRIEDLPPHLARHNPDEVTAILNRVYEGEESRLAPEIAAATRDLLEHVEW
jgi:hypothetical protein